MSQQKYYLRPNVLMEPLVNQWYAWGNLLPPQTHSMVIANLHLKIMQSYIQSPMMHANAVKNPKMRGGPFIDMPGNQSAKIKTLMAKTIDEEADMLKFAEAVKTLDQLLCNEAKGHSLLSIYEKIPQELRGYVEVGYDLNNNPSIRFIERMLYKSPLYRDSRQSIRLSLAVQDERPFVLSTPRFPDETNLHVQIPFASTAIDRLFSMKFKPAPLSQVEEFLPEEEAERAFFHSLFTTETPQFRPCRREDLADKVRARYFGHAVLLIESKEVTIMSDPAVAYSIPNTSVPRFSYEDLPESIDYVIITHNHQDHILWETLLPLRHIIKHIVVPKSNGGTLQDPSIKLFLQQTGFKSVIELDELESLPIPGGTITGIPFFGEHGELHIRSKLAYRVEIKGKTAMCAADSNNLMPEIYDYVRSALGPIDTVFVGMECDGAPMSWLYGPLLTKPLERRMDQSRRLDGSDCERALRMLTSLESKAAYIYAMGMEPWLAFISSIEYTETSKPMVESKKVVDAFLKQGLQAERLFGKKEIYL